MSIEAKMLAILEASADPALVGVPKFYGYIPQDDEKTPTAVPWLLIRRTGSQWLTDICGTRALPCFVNVDLIHAHRTQEGARVQAQAARLALINSAEQPALDAETDDFDSDVSGFVVTQSFTVEDSDPDPTRA